jgi:hypothetical protein
MSAFLKRWRQSVAPLLVISMLASMALVGLSNRPAYADTLTALCTNTTYVDGTNNASKKLNFGGGTDMIVRGTTKFAFLECAVSGVPAGATGVSAVLNVFSRSPNTSHTVRLHNQPSSWLEGAGGNSGSSTDPGVDWNALHTFDAAILSSAPGDLVPGAGEWVNLAAPTITGNGTFRFALDTTSGSDQFYASDDYTTDTTRRPKLTVTYTPPGTPPTVTTGSASNITDTSATLNGTVNPNGASTSYHFEYGPDTNYGTNVPVPDGSAGSGTTAVAESANIAGLSASTLYHFRLVATNSGGTTVGADNTFTTSPPAQQPPVVVTGSASNITTDSATLNGTVNPNGGATSYHFEYGTDTNYGTSVPVPDGDAGSGTIAVAESANVTGLSPSTVYHFRLVASNSGGTTNGNDATFTTLASGPPALRFPRPASFATATVYHASNAATVITVPAGTDARVVCDEVLHKRLVVNGGRDVYVVGCEVDINQTWPNADDQNGFGFSGQTGRVWTEGDYLHGDFINDGIKGNSGAAIWTAQNDRVGPLHGSQAGYHSDVFQPYGGFAKLEIDNVSGFGEFQCLMIKSDSATFDWNETDVGRLDCHDTQVPGSDTTARLLNWVNSDPDTAGPIHFSYFGADEFFIEPRPSDVTSQNAGTVNLQNSIAPALDFPVNSNTTFGPNQTMTPNCTTPGVPSTCSWAATFPTLVIDGHVKEMQQQEVTPNTGWFEYVPDPAHGGNVGLGYVLP